MKRISVLLFFMLAITSISFSQTKFGAGALYNSEFGVQVRADIPVQETFSIAPKATYFFISNVTTLKFDVNAHINVATVGDGIDVYGIAGPNLLYASAFGFSATEFGIDLGAGVKVDRFYGEIRWWKLFCEDCGSEIEFGAGVYF